MLEKAYLTSSSRLSGQTLPLASMGIKSFNRAMDHCFISRTLVRLLASFFVLTLSTLLAKPARAVDVVDLSADKDHYPLIDAFRILEEKTGKMTIDDVSSSEMDAKFVPIKSEYQDYWGLDLGISTSVWWIKLSVKARDWQAARKNWLMVISNNRFVGKVTFYSHMKHHHLAQAEQQWLIQSPDTEGNDSHGQDVVLKLPVFNQTPQSLYLRVESDYYIYLPISIRTAWCQMGSKGMTSLFDGMFFGVIAVIAVLNLLMFMALRDKTSLWYVLFVVFVGLYFLGTEGHITGIAKHLGPMFFAYIHVLGISGIVVFCTAFTRSFLQTATHLPRIDKFLLGYAAFSTGVAITSPLMEMDYDYFFDIFQTSTVILGVLAPVGTLVPGIARLKQGYTPAALYLAGWSAFSISAFVFAAPVIGGIDGWRIFQIGCATNVVLLTLATAHKLRMMQKERDAMSQARDTVKKALHESEEKYREIFNNSPNGIFCASLQDGELLMEPNQAFKRIFGYAAHETVPPTIMATSWLDPNDCATFNGAVKRATNVEEMEARFQKRDGTVVWCRIAARPHPDEGCFDGTMSDITERKLAEQQMFRAEKMASLGQIIAGVAHEINNPNNFVVFNIPILQRYIDSIRPVLDEKAAQDPNLTFLNMPYDMFIEDIYKLLDNMQHGSKRITDIVSELKNYVRSSDVEDKKPEVVNAIISQVMTLVGKQVRKYVKAFEVDVADDLPLVKMNAGKIEQVLINLVINAGHAADKEQSWVRLTAKRSETDAGRVEIQVQDNGAGIPKENQERIFEPFFTTKADESGTGLGLAISHQIIEDHGGSIHVESTLGQGTTFTIRLPAS
ncbi:MAG: 7TM diverse intracellular signaling domain-containing protein [Myxococcota bacterium]|nr:7TM diverse intracellular signaling domain-containing protein [Myxococcota bacterium]